MFVPLLLELTLEVCAELPDAVESRMPHTGMGIANERNHTPVTSRPLEVTPAAPQMTHRRGSFAYCITSPT